MIRSLTKCLVALAALSAIGAAAAEGFQSPTGNIHCMHISGEEEAWLRCDVREMSNTPPPAPADCDLDWGDAFEMSEDAAQAELGCHGDTVANDGNPVLEYGKSWRQGGFTCKSEKTGMSCRNKNGAGWDLSRARQTVY